MKKLTIPVSPSANTIWRKLTLENSSKPIWTRAKSSPPDENTTSKKELLTLTPGNDAEGSDSVGEDDDEWKPVELIASPCDSVAGYGGLSTKSQFKY
jgi:hypothetical protein